MPLRQNIQKKFICHFLQFHSKVFANFHWRKFEWQPGSWVRRDPTPLRFCYKLEFRWEAYLRVPREDTHPSHICLYLPTHEHEIFWKSSSPICSNLSWRFTVRKAFDTLPGFTKRDEKSSHLGRKFNLGIKLRARSRPLEPGEKGEYRRPHQWLHPETRIWDFGHQRMELTPGHWCGDT